MKKHTLILLIFALFITNGCSDSDTFCPAIGSEGKKADIVEYINNARAESRWCGDEYFSATSPIEWNETLADAAMSHSQDMADNDFFEHTGSDDSEVWDRIEAAGYDASTSGENISLGRNSSEEVVDGWLDSPGHCANIMNPDYEEIGAAAVKGDYDGCPALYWTLVFAKPETIVASAASGR